MIFLPVKPESPCGPPITNLPVGFMKYFVFSSNNSAGTIVLITCSIKSFSIVFLSTSGPCCVEITIVSILTGLLS